MNTAALESESFVLLELAGTTYGVRSRFVQHLEMVENVTPVPNALPSVEGVVFSRGGVIPAVNLRTRFGFIKAAHDIHSRLIVVNVGSRTIGLIVDSAREFVKIPKSEIQPPPESLSQMSSNYLEGVAMLDKRIVMILNLSELVKGLDENRPATLHDAKVQKEARLQQTN
jgi:purine-binding chemotaxis protein CheW